MLVCDRCGNKENVSSVSFGTVTLNSGNYVSAKVIVSKDLCPQCINYIHGKINTQKEEFHT